MRRDARARHRHACGSVAPPARSSSSSWTSTGECAHAAVADGGRALVIDDVETDNPLRVVPTSGRHVALHCTSAGKCLLA